MSDIRDDLKEDFDYLNKRVVKYGMALKTMILEDEKPPCFKPAVDPSLLQLSTWYMQELVKTLQKLLEEGD